MERIPFTSESLDNGWLHVSSSYPGGLAVLDEAMRVVLAPQIDDGDGGVDIDLSSFNMQGEWSVVKATSNSGMIPWRIVSISKIAVQDEDGPVETALLTGSLNSTVVKSLELISHGLPGTVTLRRCDENGTTYGEVSVDVRANESIFFWDGFVAIPYGHVLYFASDGEGMEAVVSAVEF